MAPCRIYLDNPVLAQSWLLNPRNPVLPRVIESIRPLVLPKLREEKERERSKKKSSKKKNVKDVIVQDDFEVSMFLTETSTRHSLLTKQKHFRETAPPMMQSNSTRLMGETNDTPFDVDAESTPLPLRFARRATRTTGACTSPTYLSQRQGRRDVEGGGMRQDDDDARDSENPSDDEGHASAIEIDSDADGLPAAKRARGAAGSDAGDEDDKKKLAMDVSYEGFAIYGRVLCLVVKRRDSRLQPSQAKADGRAAVKATAAGQGQAKMENWITSTQIPVGEEEMP
ncbi:LOW QUALITY PROTEIN: cytochrome b, succinate dehydrogenase small subunit, CybS [Purpureocillium lavendulum]|uniref:Cytochrome b, succinate dehydrogenase small subunit, CybS n=1 Tax=Purpureocillium lavendulum TaxID=1247861 RepID=A0AB34FTR4_9HYPO|nr:LOW QUALITY PROTEIN: cytochrome b, succinate dehydrogenase small subunit, CybS [Purpureocillium lavendulum]